MKNLYVLILAVVFGFCLVAGVSAADKDAIQKQVDDIVAAIDGGKMAEDFSDAAQNEPYYVFIMEEAGKLLVHPTLTGESLKEKAGPVYDAVLAATPEGNWVEYMWQEKQKYTYVRKTANGLIVGSGYSE
jgi:outer membrane murein-binding lipoprotein Lpp